MWSWFGGGSSSANQKRKDTPKNAILDLRSQLDMLQKREKYLMTQIEEQEGLAKKLVSTNKNAAKSALRRKILHEKNLEQTMNHIMTLEKQVNAIEAANINRETLAAMERAGKAMKSIHSNLSPEKVDETMDAIREQNQLSEEIVQAISTANAGDPLDEEELEAELEGLQQEQIDNQLLKPGKVPAALPNPRREEVRKPSTVQQDQATEADDEAEELRKLQAEMAM